MNKTVTFVMIGGFLGAGKTTLIARLARHYSEAGKRVGLVTNDQAYGLVDTEQLRSQGFTVGEVPGACFCCKFDDLVETTQKLSEESLPDILIAEPVGSCTDLMATVIEPMRQIYGDRFQMGPLTVLLKPEHGRKILSGKGKVGFSPKAAYIFEKQLEEANIVVINKCDKLSEDQIAELQALVVAKYPGKSVLAASGRTGLFFDQLVSRIEDASLATRTTMEMDYDTYAEGEAELGWFNCQIEALPCENRFSLDQLVLDLVEEISRLLIEKEHEPAHLKVLGQSGRESAVANFVVADEPPELSLSSECNVNKAELIVNARVGADPEALEKLIRDSVIQVSQQSNIELQASRIQSFKPGRPVPVHQIR